MCKTDLMNNTGFAPINPTFIEHEGFYYLEFEGEFYKGCRRCGGQGHYSHNGEHSRCYDCDNTSAKLGDHLGSDRKVAEKWCHERAVRKAQRDRKREAERLKVVAARDARVEALKLSDPKVLALLKKTYDDENEAYDTGDYSVIKRTNGFLRTMAGKLFNASENGLTDNMVAAVRKMVTIQDERDAEAQAHPAPSGRVVVTGKVASTKVVESDYGVAYKILVKDDQGFKVWCSLPKAQADQAVEEYTGDEYEGWMDGLKGRRITFTATLEPSRDDVSFAFGKRPTKGAWL
ncbi:hypothetical protein SEA_ANDROMEDAS_30 [Microbacterium phage Andromedas]|uniref:SsDNA binding protein n=2 Tax=Elerivirus eleri TaxID=2560589 RepID=A0A345MJ52_9CAUD|nr:hypothetical protein SEA_COLACORTA_30 [Microbacterium phage ColaCorta]AXH70708.1 hypothetical protein SEA_ANDROMEDAS_30 [Microbacterium phage Andromedas]